MGLVGAPLAPASIVHTGVALGLEAQSLSTETSVAQTGAARSLKAQGMPGRRSLWPAHALQWPAGARMLPSGSASAVLRGTHFTYCPAAHLCSYELACTTHSSELQCSLSNHCPLLKKRSLLSEYDSSNAKPPKRRSVQTSDGVQFLEGKGFAKVLCSARNYRRLGAST